MSSFAKAGRLPEPIELAERWREAGKVLAARSPEVFEEMLALFATWMAASDRDDVPRIDEIYHSA